MTKLGAARLPIGVILFFCAGFFVTLEVFVALALMSNGRSPGLSALFLPRFIGLAVGSLALATLVWPGNRMRTLGRTILIAALIGGGNAGMVYLQVPERAQLTWELGLINLAVVAGVGLLLYVRGGGGPPKWLADVVQRGSVFVRGSLNALRD